MPLLIIYYPPCSSGFGSSGFGSSGFGSSGFGSSGFGSSVLGSSFVSSVLVSSGFVSSVLGSESIKSVDGGLKRGPTSQLKISRWLYTCTRKALLHVHYNILYYQWKIT